ncbi:MAG: hypothetical protein JWL83_91 [Actinomycetia bacterium]|nr:hypothetical protein [Actinomycetes bacterium]
MSAAQGERQAGFTLSEVMVAVVILAVGVTAIVGAIGSSVFSSRVHRDMVTVDAVGRGYSEQLINASYQTCATTSTYPAMIAAPAGFKAAVTGVKYWNGTSTNPAVFGATCPPDNGLQQITIVASRTNGSGAQTFVIVKRKP